LSQSLPVPRGRRRVEYGDEEIGSPRAWVGRRQLWRAPGRRDEEREPARHPDEPTRLWCSLSLAEGTSWPAGLHSDRASSSLPQLWSKQALISESRANRHRGWHLRHSAELPRARQSRVCKESHRPARFLHRPRKKPERGVVTDELAALRHGKRAAVRSPDALAPCDYPTGWSQGCLLISRNRSNAESEALKRSTAQTEQHDLPDAEGDRAPADEPEHEREEHQPLHRTDARAPFLQFEDPRGQRDVWSTCLACDLLWSWMSLRAVQDLNGTWTPAGSILTARAVKSRSPRSALFIGVAHRPRARVAHSGKKAEPVGKICPTGRSDTDRMIGDYCPDRAASMLPTPRRSAAEVMNSVAAWRSGTWTTLRSRKARWPALCSITPSNRRTSARIPPHRVNRVQRNRIEDGPNVSRRTADHAQDLTRRRESTATRMSGFSPNTPRECRGPQRW